MPDTYKVLVDVINRVPADRYQIELYKMTSNIPTATAVLEANSGINSHTFIDLVNDSYRVRIGHECGIDTIWTDKFPVSNNPANPNTQCKKPATIAPTGGVGQVSVAIAVEPTQGVEIQIYRDSIGGDDPSTINGEGKVLVKATFFGAPTTSPLVVTGLTAGPQYVKARCTCSVTGTSESGGASMVIIYSDWSGYIPFTVT